MIKKPCTYILMSKRDGHRYIGSTVNLERRIKEHSYGNVQSTKHRRPLELIGYREFDNISMASFWERKYKRSHGQLERDLKRGIIRQV